MTATNLWKKYETDSTKELNGVEIDIEGNIFICRRAGGGNRAYRAAMGMNSLSAEFRERLLSKDQTVAVEAEDAVTLKSFADAVVVDWREVVDRNDQPLPFSKEAFVDMMLSCPDVWMQLRVAAHDLDKFRLEQVKEVGDAVGNSFGGNDDTAQT